MARYRLRYQATDLELPVGDFYIGRSSSCHLRLDDGLVSRRHAVLHIEEEAVRAQDLESRNGVYVNGARIDGVVLVRHMDHISIGSQEMILVQVGRQWRSERPTAELVMCSVCGTVIEATEKLCRRCGTPSHPTARSLESRSAPLPTAGDEDTKTAHGLQLLATIANKALALGRADEAERILAQPLDGVLREVRAGRPISEATLHDATDSALRMAEQLASPRWIDWVFQVHQAARVLIPGPAIDRLHDLVRKIRYTDSRPLHGYLESIRNGRADLTAAERFLMNRLESLARVISA